MKTTALRYLLAAILTALPVASFAGTLNVTDFRVIKDGLYLPMAGPITGSPRVWNFDAISVTSPTASTLGGVFQFDIDMTGPDPSGTSRLGFTGANAPAVFNLSRPVAALGVTFSFISPQNDAVLRVYDGPNATGKLVGSVLSPVIPPPWSAENRTIDFVAVWTDKAIIRSFVVEGSARGQGASVTGYGVSFTPVPEPAAGTLASILAFSAAGGVGRRRLRTIASTACTKRARRDA